MKRWMVAAAALLFLLGSCGAYAQETEQTAMESAINEVLSGMDFASVEEIYIELPGETEAVGVETLVRKFLSGESVSSEAIMTSLFGVFFHQLAQLKTLMLSIMLPVLLVSLLSHVLSGDAGEMKTIGRSTGYLFVLVPVIALIADQLNHTKETILLMTARMDKLLPMLLTLLTALGGSASSAFLHPVVVAASGSMVFLAREVVLRLVMCTCAVTAVNHLSLSVHLTRMAQLLRSVVCWLLGVSFTVFLGAMSLQGVCSASIDGVAIRAAKYAVDNFVPIIGGMFSDTMDTLVGCTLIVKNALGVAAAAVLLASLVSPMLGTVASVFVLKLTAALLEPVADGGIVSAIGDFSRTLVLFFVTMLCVATMYFLLIVQVLLVGNLTVMLR
ncbi:MAG: stage III sporulation protein AE [Clostridia bacterium]|nr:stage III sporulation protein AE [Clostridia bacterium]